METDMDLGTYERMLDQDLTAPTSPPTARSSSACWTRERDGGYLGRDVQVIPHVTGEIKLRLRELAAKTDADVVFVEVGGTVGDFENAYYIEACRELAYEEGEGSVVFVALTYILEPGALGEQKSKAAQLGIKRIMESASCRTSSPAGPASGQREGPPENLHVHQRPDAARVFHARCRQHLPAPRDAARGRHGPRGAHPADLHERVDQRAEDQARDNGGRFVDHLWQRRKTSPSPSPANTPPSATPTPASSRPGALRRPLGVKVNFKWIDTTRTIDAVPTQRRNVAGARGCHGIIVPGGFGVRGTEGKIECIRYARENKVPYLGMCLGFQMAVIEYARNVCGLRRQQHRDRPRLPEPVIDILPEQKKIEGLGGNMRLGGKDIDLKPGTLAARLFDNAHRQRCVSATATRSIPSTSPCWKSTA